MFVHPHRPLSQPQIAIASNIINSPNACLQKCCNANNGRFLSDPWYRPNKVQTVQTKRSRLNLQACGCTFDYHMVKKSPILQIILTKCILLTIAIFRTTHSVSLQGKEDLIKPFVTTSERLRNANQASGSSEPPSELPTRTEQPTPKVIPKRKHPYQIHVARFND